MGEVRKRVYLIMGCCAFILLGSVCSLWAEEGSPPPGQPKISFDATHYDAGEVWEGDEISHTFIVKNIGTSLLYINIAESGWACQASSHKAIPPGQEEKITIAANTMDAAGVFSKSVLVKSNDPQLLHTTISISCFVKSYISVIPGDSVVLDGYEGDKLKRSITIVSHEEQPLKITSITSTIDDKIDYTLNTIKKGKEYELEVKNRSTEIGSYLGSLYVETNSEKKPFISIVVNGGLRQGMFVKPAGLSFGTLNATGENFNEKSFRKSVLLYDVRGAGLIIEKIMPSSEWIMTETWTKNDEEARGYLVIITLDKDSLPKGNFTEKIEIYTNYKKRPLVVDLTGEVL